MSELSPHPRRSTDRTTGAEAGSRSMKRDEAASHPILSSAAHRPRSSKPTMAGEPARARPPGAAMGPHQRGREVDVRVRLAPVVEQELLDAREPQPPRLVSSGDLHRRPVDPAHELAHRLGGLLPRLPRPASISRASARATR